jgi:FkbM family methyltransferase
MSGEPMSLALHDTLRYIAGHPLNRARPLAAIARFARWQLASRLRPGLRDMPFVDAALLRVSRGMSGATGNLYCGLHEYADMAFALHFMRPGELFVDVGANVGSYTVLASAVCAARTIAFEPGVAARAGLHGNIAANRLEALVVVRAEALAATCGMQRFSSGRDSMNQLLDATDPADGSMVAVTTMDDALAGEMPTLVKIDVEGGEAQVFAGATATLARGAPRAMIVEISCPAREALIATLLGAGFSCCRYEPRERRLQVGVDPQHMANVLLVRDPVEAQQRLAAAPRRHIRATGDWL